jgi:radical SAM superfamily enzyme YgiQ (UPF0313 family)
LNGHCDLNVVLISAYELGHQPFGLASPAAWLRREGATVHCVDLAVEALPGKLIAAADMVAFYLPMHTATRIATNLIPRVKKSYPRAHICCYGLYAPANEEYLRELGAQTILGGEFEEGLVSLAKRLSSTRDSREETGQIEPVISMARQEFIVPDRGGLPGLSRYATVILGSANRSGEPSAGEKRIAGYTEASRGCKHLCRHCPVVPVYGGKFRIVQKEVVLEDIRRQVAGGARHITFGDPDFLNGPKHAEEIVREMHRAFCELTYDVTIKIEHLLQHATLLPLLRDTGCLFVTSAVESLDDHVLEIFAKHHTREDFETVVRLFRREGLTLNPTFVTFTPWTSLESYRELLARILELELVENVSPVQYAIRLLIPAGSKLLELGEVARLVGPFNQAALYFPWKHSDARVDRLYEDLLAIIKHAQRQKRGRGEIFQEVRKRAHEDDATASPDRLQPTPGVEIRPQAAIPYLSEPWFCCAEPTEEQAAPELI